MRTSWIKSELSAVSAKDMSNKLLVVIGGPTGIGKTPLTIKLAQHYHTEIINADSRQVYEELNIGVSKPTQEELAQVPHYLIGHRSIHHPYSAGQFANDALDILHKLFIAHDIVFLSGGTGLYIKAVTEGFDSIPSIPEEITDHWTNVWKKEGISVLQSVLQQSDPEYFQIVDQSNPMRLIRAISVTTHTGKSFSSFRTGKASTLPFDILNIVLTLPREELYARIDQRVLEMIENGWLEEAISLYPHRELKALQTVGYKELFEVIEGKISLKAAIPLIQQATRRYAKRQMTWWRNQGTWKMFNPEDSNSIIQQIDNYKSMHSPTMPQ